MRTLFLFHVGANAGYAIRSLEQLFLRTGLELGGADPSAVHFAYPDLKNGPPDFLPQGVQFFLHDFTDRSRANMTRLADRVREARIELVVAFDFEPIDPLVSEVKAAGARTFIAYWGAPVTGPGPRWKALVKHARFALALSKVDAIVFESQALVESAVRCRGLPRERTEVIPLGVRTDLYRPLPSSYVHDVFGFERQRRVVVYSGHMEARKGVPVLVAAALDLVARRPDVAFLLCGDREGESLAHQAAIARAGMSRHVRFGGYRSDLPLIFPSCFAGAIASTGWDSFTYSAVEMAACGLPVVASNLQGLAEAVLDRKTGILVDPGDPRALARGIETLLDDPGLAAALGTAGRRRVETELSLETQARSFKEVLLRRYAESIRADAQAGTEGWALDARAFSEGE